MRPYRYLSAVEQLSAHLREEILRGELIGGMPGVDKLAADLGCSQRTVLGALEQLQHEGLLLRQGAGRPSQITPRKDLAPTSLRVRILLYDISDMKADYIVGLRHQLQEAGQSADFAPKTLVDLGMDLRRVARFIGKMEADAWIIFGASREILEWFSARPEPAFALFGRFRSVPIAGAGPDKLGAIAKVVRCLTELGHRRIAMLGREERRKPVPGQVERVFLEELQAQGITVGSYNLPDWEDDVRGFQECLVRLFQHTPPTALIPDTLELYMATMQFLAREGFRVPGDVSLVCTDPHPSFYWCDPPISHIGWNSDLVVRNIMRWVNKVARGIDYRRQVWVDAEFVEGGTIGPPPLRSK